MALFLKQSFALFQSQAPGSPGRREHSLFVDVDERVPQQELHHVDVAFLGGQVQRGAAVLPLNVDL